MQPQYTPEPGSLLALVETLDRHRCRLVPDREATAATGSPRWSLVGTDSGRPTLRGATAEEVEEHAVGLRETVVTSNAWPALLLVDHDGQQYRAVVEQEFDDLGDDRGTTGPVGEPYVAQLERLREYTDGRETWLRMPTHSIEDGLSDAVWDVYRDHQGADR